MKNGNNCAHRSLPIFLSIKCFPICVSRLIVCAKFHFNSYLFPNGLTWYHIFLIIFSYLSNSFSAHNNVSSKKVRWVFKGCGMGPWLVLVSPCFRENVVATCKIGSFLCSLDNLLQKNVIVFFFGNQVSKWRSFEKRAIFDLLFTFSSHQGKVTKIPSAHISLTYIHVFCSPYWPFLPYQFWKKYEFIRYRFSLVWVLVLILIRAILEQSINNKMVSKI